MSKKREGSGWFDAGPSSLQQRCEVVPPPSFRQLNYNLYEVWRPTARPTVEVVFFHGLQREDTMDQAHLSTWSSRGEERELCAFIVAEASARHDVDGLLYTDRTANHFDVCRPEKKTSTSFHKLRAFIDRFLREDRRLQVPKKNFLKYTVGVGAMVDSMRRVLDNGNRRLAIVGMGGIGKTTVARQLFDTIGNDFDYICFVDDVKGKMKNKKSEERLRWIITEDLMWKGRMVKEDRYTFDWSMLETNRVLIMLDDVDRKEHVMILNREDQFLKQSCLVTTSREKHRFLEEHDFEFHEMGTLNPSDAEKLLCWHASRREMARPETQKWVKLLAKKCGYLPLALEAVGRRLINRIDDKELCKGVYEKIKEAKSIDGKREDSLWSILEWSYDELERDEQDMFLDIATIFHGSMLKHAELIWESYLSPWKLTWDNLVNKCLVSLINGCIINMHELYRVVGRRKANPNPADVATHTRVFEKDKFIELLEKPEQKDAAVKVLWYSTNWKLFSKSRWNMRRWTNLRVVWNFDYTPGVGMTRDGALRVEMMFPPSVQCARIQLVGSYTIQHIHRAKALRCLILHSELRMEQLPSSVCKLSELNHLQISNTVSKATRFYSSSPLSSEPLPYLTGFFGLSALVRLKILQIEGCEQLTKLPESLGQLSALSKLRIHSVGLTELPASLGHLSALVELSISTCHHLSEIPKSLGQLQTLKQLKLRYLRSLKKLPESIGQLRDLQHLIINQCNIERLPESFGQLQSLKRLEIWSLEIWSRCDTTVDVSASLARFCLASLEELKIEGCKLPNLGGFIDQAPSLQHLELGNVRSEELPISVGQTGTGPVKRLTIKHCLQSEIAVLPNSLEYLQLQSCNHLVKLPDSLGQLLGLRKLVIEMCKKLGDWRPSTAVGANLQELQFRDYQIPPVIFSSEDLLKLAIEGRSLREGAMQMVDTTLSDNTSGNDPNAGFVDDSDRRSGNVPDEGSDDVSDEDVNSVLNCFPRACCQCFQGS